MLASVYQAKAIRLGLLCASSATVGGTWMEWDELGLERKCPSWPGLMKGNGRGESCAVEQHTTFADCVILRYPMIELSSQPDRFYCCLRVAVVGLGFH
jgi:hypothetical protein